MDKMNLSRLKRAELLEIMLSQSEEIDALRARVADLEQQLASREIALQNVGSIAEAALRLNKVFEDAQKAADQYLENVRLKAEKGMLSAAPAAGKPQPRPTLVVKEAEVRAAQSDFAEDDVSRIVKEAILKKQSAEGSVPQPAAPAAPQKTAVAAQKPQEKTPVAAPVMPTTRPIERTAPKPVGSRIAQPRQMRPPVMPTTGYGAALPRPQQGKQDSTPAANAPKAEEKNQMPQNLPLQYLRKM